MARYGTIHQITDFVERAIPRRGHGAKLFVHRIISFMKALDAVQENNAFVTIIVQTGDMLKFYFKQQSVFMLLPGQTHMRLLLSDEPSTAQKNLKKLIRVSKAKGLFLERMGVNNDQWRCYEKELDALLRFSQSLPKETAASIIGAIDHPRNFSSETRQAALRAFEDSGRMCPGYHRRKRHRVAKGIAIEFDHVLPHAKNGSNTAQNCQVLCSDCNRAKATSV